MTQTSVNCELSTTKLIPKFTPNHNHCLMLNHVILENALVFDIETVPGHKTWDEVPTDLQPLWARKAKQLKIPEEISPAESFVDQAGIYAEFGKVVCISVGFFTRTEGGKYNLRVTSFYGDDERTLLQEFGQLLSKHFNTANHFLVGHNINEFDIPYVCRRMIVHGLELPDLIDIAGKKPWEVKHIDTMQYWKFGDYKSYTSLKLLAAILGIPTPKDDIDGSDVARVYWQDHDLPRIVTYCQKDVVTTARLLQRYKGLPTLTDEDVVIA